MSGQLRYSDDQRDAIVSAVLDDGLSARESAEKASAGELGVPAFDIPVSTAQAIVTDAKNRGRVADNTDRLHRLVHAMLDIAQAGATKLEQKAKRGTLTAQDATFGRRLTQLAGHAAQLNHVLAQDPPPARPPSPKSAQDLRERMERDLAARNARDQAADSEPQPAPRPSPREQLVKELQEVATAPAADPGRHTAT